MNWRIHGNDLPYSLMDSTPATHAPIGVLDLSVEARRDANV